MKSLIVVSSLVISAWAAPQVTFGANDEAITTCGVVNGQERNVGDTWKDDCNNCVCRETGIATCTKIFCGKVPVIRNPNEAPTSCGVVNGEERSVGDTWADDCNNCICRETGIATCTKRFCGPIPVIRNPNEAPTSCGIVNGEERNVGDTWADDCNNCICRETGIPTCTKRFCGKIPVIRNEPVTTCGVVNGQERNVGDTWMDECNKCVCRETGIPTCTKIFCGNIPVIRNPNEPVTTCGVVNGQERNVGDTWKDDCNNCVCRETGIATCTKRFCGDRAGIQFAAVCKNVINGEDRQEGESWTAADGCNKCKCLKTGIPGCTKKLCLNAPVIGANSPVKGGLANIPCVGCPQESEVDEDITAAAAHATASLSGISDSGCGGIKLVEVVNARKQVVAGTNFFLTLKLETRKGQGCSEKTEKICENIQVFKPLPFACKSEDGCLTLEKQTDISCKPVLPAVCKNAINGEDRLVGETWTAADGCNTCRCPKSGIPVCTKKFCLDKPLITSNNPVRDTSLSCPGCPQESVKDREIKLAAIHATASLSGISDSGCGGIKLVEVVNAKKQVVAGTNFFLTLKLETREGQGCAEKTEKICENIQVFKPLPHACQSDDGCLNLEKQTDISCKPVLPAVCKNAINGEVRLEGETWTAADGCNTCRCPKSGIPGCTKKFCLDKPLITLNKPVRDTSISCPGCPQASVKDREIKLAAIHATASLSGISDSSCGGIKLVKVEKAQKQVVAGTNYFLTLKLETSEGQGCADKTEKICENIVVFKPLPFACKSEDGCLKLTSPTDISCKPVIPDRSLSCPGCAQETVIDEEIFSAAAHATASLAGVNTVSGCGGINLVKIENAKKQVVAGTNYILSLRLETRSGQGCASKTEKICENIVVFKPLPFACQSGDGCLKLTKQPGIICKEVQPSRAQLQSASSILSLSKGVQTSNIRQCQGEGKENCQAVNINNNVLDNLSIGQKVALLPGLNVDLSLKQPPTQGSSSTSFVFNVGQFGEAILTRGNSRSSMFGSIKPDTGNIHYTIENCGDGCNVIYQRDAGFFNQFKD